MFSLYAVKAISEKFSDVSWSTEDIHKIVTHRDPLAVVGALAELKQVGLLTGASAQANFDAVVAHANPQAVTMQFLKKLNQVSLLRGSLAQANFDAVVVHANPRTLMQVLKKLNQVSLLRGSLAQANFDAVVACQDPRNLLVALNELHRARLLAVASSLQANFAAVMAHSDPVAVVQALKTLNRLGLLSEDLAEANRDAIVAHANPRAVALALNILHQEKLLTGVLAEANRDAILAHRDPEAVAYALKQLNLAGLLHGDLAEVNRHAAVKNPFGIGKAITQEFIRALQAPPLWFGRHPLQDHLDAMLVLFADGINLSKKQNELVREIAAKELQVLLSQRKPIEINWRLVRLLGVVYMPSEKHPIHGKIAGAMKSGGLEVEFANEGPAFVLKLLYRLLSSEKPELYSWIRKVFSGANKADELIFVRTPEWNPDLIARAEGLRSELLSSVVEQATSPSATTSTSLAFFQSNEARQGGSLVAAIVNHDCS